MGTYIKLYAEKKVDGVWMHAQDNDLVSDGEDRTIPNEKQLYGIQDYEFFAILAGVRNFHGVTPLAQPRGLPSDLSEFIKAESEIFPEDSFCYSHFTFRELQEFDWEGTTYLNRSHVSPDVARHYHETGVMPDSYSCTRAGIPPEENECPKGRVLLERTATYAEEAEYFLKNTMKKLEQFGSPDDVRIVFWFD